MVGQQVALREAFFDHLQRRTFPGGASLLARRWRQAPARRAQGTGRRLRVRFVALIRGLAAAALAQGSSPLAKDPDQLAFERNGIILAADTNFVLHDDPGN